MNKLKKLVNTIGNRRITANRFLWKCYGDFVLTIDVMYSGYRSYSFVYNPLTGKVFEVRIILDYGDYRWIRKDYVDAVKAEYKDRGYNFNQDSNHHTIEKCSFKHIMKIIRNV